jgi:hypothetical protein
MNGFRKIFPSFLSHYATFFAKMGERKGVPFDEFYYQLKLKHLFQKHPVYVSYSKNKDEKCSHSVEGSFIINIFFSKGTQSTN